MPKLVVAGTGAYLPEKRVTNEDLAQTLGETSDEWIFSHTGIRSRRIAADDEAASDMAYAACRRALEHAEISPEEIGTLILATATPDYGGFPSTACVVQDRLGLVNAAAFDVTAACSGFAYGLALADGLAHRDSRPKLVVGTELLSRITDWSDCKTCVLFGDGAGAVVLTSAPGNGRGILGSYLGSDGTGTRVIYREGGVRKSPNLDVDGKIGEMVFPTIQMNGRGVFNFAVKVMEEVITHFLTQFDLEIDDVHYIVPHQANYRIIRKAAARLGIDEKRFFLNLEETANTSSASIPIALSDMNDQGLLKRGDLIMTVGFGAGLTYAGNLLRW